MGNKLLLADDSITIQKVVGIIFSSDEYDLTIVDNGSAAIDKASEIMPDVMLVDAIMPGKTGYEVAQAIRSDARLKHTPILLLTGAFEPFDENQARTSGIDDFIAKPFESQHLIDKVQKLLVTGKERAAAAPAAAPSPAPAAAAAPSPAPAAAPAPEPALTAAAVDPWQDFSMDTPEPAAAPAEAFSFADESEEEAFTVETTEQPVAASPADDLWGAFEVEEVPEAEGEDVAVVEIGSEAPAAVEEDPFAFSMEEDITPEEKPAAAAETMGGAQAWQEEEAFSFAEEPEPAPAASAAEEFAIESFSPEPEPFAPAEPEVFIPPPAPAAPVKEAPAPQAAPAAQAAQAAPAAAAPAGSMTLTEEQLAGLVSKISRDIIEKIAWEVVPDLAEALIKEEIRKIKEGQ